MPHPRLDLDDVGAADRERSERVAQVVESQRSQAGALKRLAVAPAQPIVREVAAVSLREDERSVVM
jgi:hypothetical protein